MLRRGSLGRKGADQSTYPCRLIAEARNLEETAFNVRYWKVSGAGCELETGDRGSVIIGRCYPLR